MAGFSRAPGFVGCTHHPRGYVLARPGVRAPGAERIQPRGPLFADAVDAFGPGVDPEGTWYDELLVSDGHVVVIGYSYDRNGMEVGLFDIGRDGRLRYRSTYHLRSSDYYASRNYARRLVGGKLVLYAPVGVGKADDANEWMPAIRRWHPGGAEEEFQPTLRPTRIASTARAARWSGATTCCCTR